MSIQDYILAAKPLVPLTITGQSDWDSAPEIGVIGGGKVSPKSLSDREISHLVLDANGYVRGGQTGYNTGTGFFLGYAGTAYKLSIGDASTNFLTFDGTNLAVGGAITASSGTIGSFTIGTYLYTGTKTAYNDANAGVHLGSDGIGIGNNVFTVSSAGALVATSATITGAITATSGTIGGWTITGDDLTCGTIVLHPSAGTAYIALNATDRTTGNGAWFAALNTTAEFRVGSVAAGVLTAGIMFDQANLSYVGVNTSLTAAGVFTASNAVITGAITATSGSLSGLSVTGTLTLSGSGKLITAASPAARIELSTTEFAGYSDATTKQFYAQASDGIFYAGSGNAGIDNTGVWIRPLSQGSYFRVHYAGDSYPVAHLSAIRNADATKNLLYLGTVNHSTGDAGAVYINISIDGFTVHSTTTSYIQNTTGAANYAVGSGNHRFYVGGTQALQVNVTGIYPGNQTTRYISDNGSNIVVDGMAPATHTHSGAGQGGTVAVASVTGAAPLASPTFTGTVIFPDSGRITSTGFYPGNQTSHYITGGASGIGIDRAPSYALDVGVSAAAETIAVRLINANAGGYAVDLDFATGANSNRSIVRLVAPVTGSGGYLDIQTANSGTGTMATGIRILDTNVTVYGTLTVSGNQTGATDHVFDSYDDIALLQDWRAGKALPFATGDLLNRDRLLRDTIIGLEKRVVELETKLTGARQ